MSESLNFPTVMPSLLLDFANRKSLDPRITFTRASTATYYDEDTVAKAEENLLTYSQEFEVGPDTNWENAANTSIVTANSTSAPDGTSTADTIAQTAVTNTFILQQRKTILANTNYTISTFVKNIDINYVAVALFGATGNAAYAEFDLTTGTLNRSGANGTGWAVVSTAIQNVGNSWYRISAVITAGNTVSTPRQRFMLTDGTTAFSTSGTVSFAGTNLSAYFWGAQLEQRSAVTAYTPTTTQQITNYIPVLMTAAVGVPRFIFDPTTRESLGLLIEEQRTNLLTYSEDFTAGVWNKSNSTITSNTIVAPDGTLTGDKLVENTANAGHILDQSLAVTTGVTYVSSIFAKAGERTSFSFRANNDNSVVTFNLADGTAGAATNGTAFITPLGNGWYRCSLVWTATTTATVVALRIRLLDGSGASSYTGDGFSGVYIWGAQMEAGAFPTSYIPTVASSVTRSTDAASMTGVNFSEWYRQDEGTFYGDCLNLYPLDSSVNAAGILSVNNATSAQIMRFDPRRVQIIANSVTQANINTISAISSGLYKSAFAYAVDNIGMSTNASNVGTDTSAILPIGVNRLQIGLGLTASGILNGTIKKIAYYPWRLTNAQLQALTS